MNKFKYLIISIFLFLGLINPVYANNIIDFSNKGSIEITLMDNEDVVGIEGAEITIYKVANAVESNHNLVFEYVDELAGCGVNLTNLEVPTIAQDISECMPTDLTGLTDTTDVNGVVKFDNIDLGLYLVVQNNRVEGYSIIDSFLVMVPVEKENNWEYDIEALPKTDIYKVIDVTVIKKWNSNGSKIPNSIEIALYKGEEIIDTVTLSKDNNWTYTWENIEKSESYKVLEVNVPDNYTVTYKQNEYTFTVINTDTLVNTGQIYFPIIILTVMGIVFIVLGLIQYKRITNE